MKSILKVHQLKIILSRVTPPIWRRVQVSEEVSLYNLASILICTMGWHGGHLHQFRIGEDLYGLPDEEFGEEMDIIDERDIVLKDLLKYEIEQFIFEYDFGDGWEHVVKIEKVVEFEPKVKYPICIDGKRRCPPEDCGGSHGYEEFLEAIRDPKHFEHESMLEWIGGEFDPEEFNCDDFSDLAERAEAMEELWDEHF